MYGDQVAAEFKGKRWTQTPHGEKDEEQEAAILRFKLGVFVGMHAPGLGRKFIHYGENGGYQAINIAYLLGAKRIVLLGYDMYPSGGKLHFFGNYPGELNSGCDFAAWRGKFDRLATDLEAEGVEVINCTRETALKCFPRGDIRQCLDNC
jgi:hypothetical protein